MNELEERRYIHIVWQSGKQNHIISKVILLPEMLEEAYRYVKRVPKSELVASNLAMIEECMESYDTPVCRKFVMYLRDRLLKHQAVKEYIDLADMDKTKQMLRAVYEIESNSQECYLREFSIKVFHDSKGLENMRGKLSKIFYNFGASFGEMVTVETDAGESDISERDFSELLAEYGIYHTPNYVYFKGAITLTIRENVYRIETLKQGIGISGEDLPFCRFEDVSAVKRIITIENLTTFFRWNEPNSLIIYLGGYHNSVRRSLLKEVYAVLPEAKYYHFGDIDAGGYEIYGDLCRKTGIPFELYHMDLETLSAYRRYGKELTTNDRKRLEKIQNKADLQKEGVQEVISYMLANNVKLEQECVISV